MAETIVRDTFDRTVANLDGVPDVHRSRPSTITSTLPMIGATQTFVVQTYSTDEGNFVFLQSIDAEGRYRIVIPPKVANAIYRQREALIVKGRKVRGRARWEGMPEHERADRIAKLRAGKSA